MKRSFYIDACEAFIYFLFFNFALNSFFQEYKKGESQTNIEIMKEEDFSKILEMEEAYIKKTCDDIIRYSPDLVSSTIWVIWNFWWG